MTHAIESSLEAVADVLGDPTERVYERLFEHSPELREMFVLDTDGSVRGEMLHRVFETVLTSSARTASQAARSPPSG